MDAIVVGIDVSKDKSGALWPPALCPRSLLVASHVLPNRHLSGKNLARGDR
jgi:hypothetical protein